MAKTIEDISKSKEVLLNPSAIYLVPYKDNNTEGDKYFKITDVIQDSTSLTQDDPETTEILSEFSSSPITSNTKLGAFNFSAQVADSQSALLKALCGYEVDSLSSRAYAPGGYSPLYVKIALTFKKAGGKEIAAVLPKVLLNSKLTLESLSSNMGTITLAGKGQNVSMSINGDTKETPFYIDYDFQLATDLDK